MRNCVTAVCAKKQDEPSDAPQPRMVLCQHGCPIPRGEVIRRVRSNECLSLIQIDPVSIRLHSRTAFPPLDLSVVRNDKTVSLIGTATPRSSLNAFLKFMAAIFILSFLILLVVVDGPQNRLIAGISIAVCALLALATTWQVWRWTTNFVAKNSPFLQYDLADRSLACCKGRVVVSSSADFCLLRLYDHPCNDVSAVELQLVVKQGNVQTNELVLGGYDSWFRDRLDVELTRFGALTGIQILIADKPENGLWSDATLKALRENWEPTDATERRWVAI